MAFDRSAGDIRSQTSKASFFAMFGVRGYGNQNFSNSSEYLAPPLLTFLLAEPFLRGSPEKESKKEEERMSGLSAWSALIC